MNEISENDTGIEEKPDGDPAFSGTGEIGYIAVSDIKAYFEVIGFSLVIFFFSCMITFMFVLMVEVHRALNRVLSGAIF